MEFLSELEKQILKLRQEEGYSIKEVLEELNIKQTAYNKAMDNIKILGLYDEELIEAAKEKRKTKKRYEKYKSDTHEKLSEEENEYRKKCIDLLSNKYFNYQQTHKVSPVLIQRISLLKKKATYKVIYNTIKIQERSLDYANTKNFPTEFSKVSYMITIIKNNMEDTIKKMDIQEKLNSNAIKGIGNDLISQLNKETKEVKVNKVDMTSLLDD